MTQTIKDKVLEDMKKALRNQEKERLGAVRLILAAIKQREIDERTELTDEQIRITLNKMIKQRREAIQQFQAGNRNDLAEKEALELRVIQEYLPAQLSDTELDQLIATALHESGASSAKDMGKVMGLLKPRLQGKADMALVSMKVKERLVG